MKTVHVSIRIPAMDPVDEVWVGDDIDEAVGMIAGQALKEAYDLRKGKVVATVSVDVTDVDVKKIINEQQE